jgi:hypothetical protein
LRRRRPRRHVVIHTCIHIHHILALVLLLPIVTVTVIMTVTITAPSTSASTASTTSSTTSSASIIFQHLQLSIQFLLTILQRPSRLGKFAIAVIARIALKEVTLGISTSQANMRMFDAQSVGSQDGLGHQCVRRSVIVVVVHHWCVLIIMVINGSGSISINIGRIRIRRMLMMNQDKLFQHGMDII